jgi:lipopolysaccharide heptosyltransferase II
VAYVDFRGFRVRKIRNRATMTISSGDLASGSGFGKGYDYPPGAGERWWARERERVKRAAKGVLRATLGAVGAVDALLHPRLRRPALTPATFHPRRILVIRTDLLGDVVMTLPAIRALRQAYPAARIDLAVLPANVALLRDQPEVDRVIACDPEGWLGSVFDAGKRAKLRAARRDLRAQRYDLAVSVCGEWASIVARLSGARRRVGFAGEAYPHFLTDPAPGRRFTLGMHEVDYGLALAARAGAGIPAVEEARLPRLYVPEAAREHIRVLLAGHGVAPDRPLVALHAGSGNGQAKRWPLPYWARLANLLLNQTDVTVVLIGAPGDAPLARAVLRRMRSPARVVDLTGQTTLPELAALLQACAVVVTGDSGPLHVAEAVGTPVVALHGPTNPAESGPVTPASIILRRAIWCAPCYDSRATAECRFGNPLCMKGIAPAEVYAATRALLHPACDIVE